MVLVATAACRDGTASDGGSGSGTDGEVGTTEGTPPDTDPGDSTATASGTDTETTDAGPLTVSHEVVTYPEQPMVADLVLHLSPPVAATATASVTHPDAGVIASPLPTVGDDDLVIRLRGMMPDEPHSVQYSVQANGEQFDDTADFTLPPPLPGFRPGFAIETTAREPEPLYRLIDHNPFPIGGTTGLFMIDPQGTTRWYLGDDTPAINADAIWAAATLLPDGSVLYLRNHTIWRRDELGAPIWQISADDVGVPGLHHHVQLLPNGNVLALGYTFRDIDYGPGPGGGVQHVAGDLIVEITPDDAGRGGTLVWQWDSFDHLDPLRIRDGFELGIADPVTGQQGRDWTHGNGLAYDPDTDAVLVSMRHQDWLVRVDRGVDGIVWRLGDEGDFTLDPASPTPSPRWFFHQHSPQWEPDGSLLLYDNGVGNPGLPDGMERSRAVRYEIDEAASVATEVWSDEDGVPAFTSIVAGDAERISDARVMILDSVVFDTGLATARVRELAAVGDPTPVWTLRTEPEHFIYRATAWSRLVGMAER